MISAGIRELKDNLSHYVRKVDAGERVAVTAHGRVVAELGPPGDRSARGHRRPFDDLVATGVVRLPIEAGDPLEDWPRIRLRAGTVRDLIASDRGEA